DERVGLLARKRLDEARDGTAERLKCSRFVVAVLPAEARCSDDKMPGCSDGVVKYSQRGVEPLHPRVERAPPGGEVERSELAHGVKAWEPVDTVHASFLLQLAQPGVELRIVFTEAHREGAHASGRKLSHERLSDSAVVACDKNPRACTECDGALAAHAARWAHHRDRHAPRDALGGREAAEAWRLGCFTRA